MSTTRSTPRCRSTGVAASDFAVIIRSTPAQPETSAGDELGVGQCCVDRGLDVAGYGVDPLERRPARRPLSAGDYRPVLQAGLDRRGPAAEPVGDQAAGRGR